MNEPLVCKSVPDLYCYIFHKRWSHVLHESGRLILQSRWMNEKRMSSKLARKRRYMHVLSLFSTFDSQLRSTWLLVFALAMFSSRSVSMDIFSSFRSTISSNWVKVMLATATESLKRWKSCKKVVLLILIVWILLSIFCHLTAESSWAVLSL